MRVELLFVEIFVFLFRISEIISRTELPKEKGRIFPST